MPSRRRRRLLLTPSGELSFLGASLLAWWDFSDPATVFTDTAGITPAVASDPVARVNDKVGALHLVQATGTAQPVLQADGSALFDGTTDFLSIESTGNLPVSSNPSEMYMACAQTAAAGDGLIRYALAYGGVASLSLRGIARQDLSGTNRAVGRVGTGATNTAASNTTAAFDGKHSFGAAIGATSSIAYIDGVAGSSAAVVPNTSTNRTRIGANTFNTVSQFFGGKIITAVVTLPLTAGQRTLLAAYLAEKRDQMT